MEEEEEEVAVVPSGYRFVPTDLELVRDYLRKKITNQKLPSDVPIVEYDIYTTEPWNLPVNNKIDTINSKRSYYFVRLLDGIGSLRKRIVNPSSSSSSSSVDDNGGGRRKSFGGYWEKIVGGRHSRYIRDESYRSIGVKKSFVFHAYLSSPPPPLHCHCHTNNNTTTATSSSSATTTTAMNTWKTNWIIDEYSLNSQRNHPWVLCILRKKIGGVGRGGGGHDDEVELLSSLQQAQEKVVLQQPTHDYLDRELENLEKIKTIQDRIRTNQIQIWDDQYELWRLNEDRVWFRFQKRFSNSTVRFGGYVKEMVGGKISNKDLITLGKQVVEAEERELAETEAEAAVLRAGSYYVVELPSRFRKRKRKRRGGSCY